MKEKRDDYCSAHGGIGSETKPCLVCGKLRSRSQIPEIPKGLSLDEAMKWGASEICLEIKRNITK